MVKVDIQLHENKDSYFPGDIVSGDVLLTTSKPVEIPQIVIKLRGIAHLNMHREIEIEQHYIQSSETDAGSSTAASPSEHGNYPHNTSPGLSSRPPVIRTESREMRHDVVFYRSDKYWITRTPVKLECGVNLFSFEVKLPNNEETYLLPTFSSNSRVVNIEYYIEAVVSVPLPIWKSFTVSKRHKKSFHVVQRTLITDMQLYLKSNFADSEASVGYWTKESASLGSLIKYAFGADTAKFWQDYSVRVKLPRLLTVVEEPYYLQDRTLIEIESKGTPQRPVAVDAVSLKVVSTYIYKSSSEQISTPILNNSNPLFTQIDEFRDITFLISGAKLPQHLAPSLNQHGLSISHVIVFHITLKSISEDETKQSPANLEVSLPLVLSCSKLKQEEVGNIDAV